MEISAKALAIDNDTLSRKARYDAPPFLDRIAAW